MGHPPLISPNQRVLMMVRVGRFRAIHAFLSPMSLVACFSTIGKAPLTQSMSASTSMCKASEQMASAVPSPGPRWLQDLAGSIRKNKQPADKYVQLATVSAEGKPAVRTVVFRGLLSDYQGAKEMPGGRETLSFITDSRSEKMKDGLDAEICWYLTGTREQYRFSGALEMVTESSSQDMNNFRKFRWQKMSENARKQFLWPNPGEHRPTSSAEQDKADFEEVQPSEMEPPHTFILMLLRPYKVDYLRLKGFPQRRTKYERPDGGADWLELDVNP